jgi:hypothetical protein
MTGLTDEPGEGGGTLSDHLTLQVERIDGGTAVPVWTGALGDLPAVDLGTLAAGAARDFRLTATMPELGPAIDDRFAGGAVEVGYRWTALGDADPAPPKEPEKTTEPAQSAPPEEPEQEIESGPSPAPWLAVPGPDDDNGRAGRGAAVRLWLGGRSSQRLGSGLKLAAACRPGCGLTARTQVRAGGRWRSLGRRQLGALGETSQPAPLRLSLSPRQRRVLRGLLGARKALTLRIRVTAAAPGHDPVTKARSLRLRP